MFPFRVAVCEDVCVGVGEIGPCLLLFSVNEECEVTA